MRIHFGGLLISLFSFFSRNKKFHLFQLNLLDILLAHEINLKTTSCLIGVELGVYLDQFLYSSAFTNAFVASTRLFNFVIMFSRSRWSSFAFVAVWRFL